MRHRWRSIYIRASFGQAPKRAPQSECRKSTVKSLKAHTEIGCSKISSSRERRVFKKTNQKFWFRMNSEKNWKRKWSFETTVRERVDVWFCEVLNLEATFKRLKSIWSPCRIKSILWRSIVGLSRKRESKGLSCPLKLLPPTPFGFRRQSLFGWMAISYLDLWNSLRFFQMVRIKWSRIGSFGPGDLIGLNFWVRLINSLNLVD